MSVEADSNRIQGKHKAGLAVLLGSLAAFGPLSIDMYLPSLPSLSRDLHAGTSSTQLTLTACLLGLAFGQLVAGPVSDTFGRRRPLLVGIFIYVIVSALCVIAPSVPVLIALRFLQGLGGAAGLVISRAVARDLFSGHDLVRFFAMLALVFGLAPIAAPLLGGQLLRFTTWRGVFGVLTVAGSLLFLGAALFLRESHRHEARRAGGFRTNLKVFSALIKEREFLGYVLSCGLAVAVILVYVAGSPFVLQDIYGLSAQSFSLCFGANSLGILLASQLSAKLVARLGAKKLLTAGLVSMSIGATLYLVAVLADLGLVAVLMALFLTVSSAGLVGPNASALALEDHGDKAGSASALLGMFQFVIGAAVAPLVGIAGPQTAIPMALAMTLLGVAAITVRLTLNRSGDDERSYDYNFMSEGSAA